ncbi:hypothetical protein Tco_0643651 [Tanacetum coccineum]
MEWRSQQLAITTNQWRTSVIGSAIEVALLFQAAGQKPYGSLKAPQSATPTGHYDRFLLGAYWDTTLVILMVATAASLALGIKSEKGNLYFCFPYLTVQVNTRVHDGRGHTALTSECGSMLEEVLAITRGLHDVRKEASALHSSFMGDLSNVLNVEGMTEAIPTKKRAKAVEIFNDTKVAAQVPCCFGAESCCLDTIFLLKGAVWMLFCAERCCLDAVLC